MSHFRNHLPKNEDRSLPQQTRMDSDLSFRVTQMVTPVIFFFMIEEILTTANRKVRSPNSRWTHLIPQKWHRTSSQPVLVVWNAKNLSIIIIFTYFRFIFRVKIEFHFKWCVLSVHVFYCTAASHILRRYVHRIDYQQKWRQTKALKIGGQKPAPTHTHFVQRIHILNVE